MSISLEREICNKLPFFRLRICKEITVNILSIAFICRSLIPDDEDCAAGRHVDSNVITQLHREADNHADDKDFDSVHDS